MSIWLNVIGVGEGGVAELPAVSRRPLHDAEAIIGPDRLLAQLIPSPTLPTHAGEGAAPGHRKDDAQSRVNTLPLVGRVGEGVRLIQWQAPFTRMLEQIMALRGMPTVILATGDPIWFGIGATLAGHLNADEFVIHPHPSAFQLAASRLHWPLQNVVTLSLHGRPPELVQPHILPGNRILALTSDATTATHVAQLLVARGYGQSQLTVLENIGGANERVVSAAAEGFDLAIGDFYVLAIDCVADAGAALLPAVPGLPDIAFISDGQLTKREVRAASLAKLSPFPGALLWDVGAGCGSVAIEWLRAARDTQAIAFERQGERLQILAVNASALGVPHLQIERGEAPASLAGMAAPDAIFLGGGVGDETLFEACWATLKSGGRLVANAVTLDGEAALYRRQAQQGGELSRIEISVLDQVGAHRVMRPRMAVTQWLVLKP